MFKKNLGKLSLFFLVSVDLLCISGCDFLLLPKQPKNIENVSNSIELNQKQFSGYSIEGYIAPDNNRPNNACIDLQKNLDLSYSNFIDIIKSHCE